MRRTARERGARGLLRSEKGTALVEFAILAPVFLFLLVGLIEIGRYTYFALLTANAVRVGVQYGAQNLSTAADTSGMVNAATQDAQNLPSSITTTIQANHLCYINANASTPCPANSTPQSTWVYFVQVTATGGTVASLFRYPGIPQNVPISASATMRVVNQ